MRIGGKQQWHWIKDKLPICHRIWIILRNHQFRIIPWLDIPRVHSDALGAMGIQCRSALQIMSIVGQKCRLPRIHHCNEAIGSHLFSSQRNLCRCYSMILTTGMDGRQEQTSAIETLCSLFYIGQL